MGLTRNYFAKWMSTLLVLIILLLFHSSVHAQWTSVTPPTVGDGGRWMLTGVNFSSATEGWAVGWDQDRYIGVLLHYQNGIWTSVNPPDVNGDYYLTAVHFTSADEGWAVGIDSLNSRGILLHYQNGFWTLVDSPTVSANWELNGVHFTSASEGWAVGYDNANPKGVLLHYQNGNWTSVTPPTVSSSWYLSGVHFSSATEGWAAGSDSTNSRRVLLHYVNGAWTLVTPPLFAKNWVLKGIHSTSVNQGWAVGYDNINNSGALVHLNAGGWTEMDNPPTVSDNWNLNGVHFTSENEGWAVGSDLRNSRGVLLRCNGWDWTFVTTPTVSESWELNGVHFTSAAEGWAVGYDVENFRGVLLRYLAVSPNKGTVGTKLTIAGSYFGSKKGKVLIGDTPTKIIGWESSAVSCEIKKTLLPGSHDVVIQSKVLKDALFINYPEAFTVMEPEIQVVKPSSGKAKTTILLSGMFLGTKKGKVYLGDKKCRVLSWNMNATTGESGIQFVVPDKMAPGPYDVTVTNKVGSDTLADGFTIIVP